MTSAAGKIYVVDPKFIDGIWTKIDGMVVAALRGTPTHDSNDVRLALKAGKAHLFVQVAHPVIEAIAVIEIMEYPKGRWLNFWLVAAQPERELDTEAFDPAMQAFRKAHNCRGYQITGGRHGWVRKMQPHTVEGVSMRWTFE